MNSFIVFVLFVRFMVSKNDFKKFKYLEFEKLIRDDNINIHKEYGGECFYRILEKEEFIKQLKLKLVEEAQEVLDAKTKEEATDELGDVVEVLRALIKVGKFNRFKIWNARRKKAKQRGRFKKGVYCKYVKFPVDLKQKWMWKYKDITDKIEKAESKNDKLTEKTKNSKNSKKQNQTIKTKVVVKKKNEAKNKRLKTTVKK